MAKPIRETPELKGKYAKAFMDSVRADDYDEKKAEFLKQCKEVHATLSKK